MLSPIRISAIVLALSAIGTKAESKDTITLDLKYRTKSLNIGYAMGCINGSTCTLSSEEGAPLSWHVAVTPKKLPNGILSISTVISEQGKEVSRSEVKTKANEEVRIVSGTDSDTGGELVIRAY